VGVARYEGEWGGGKEQKQAREQAKTNISAGGKGSILSLTKEEDTERKGGPAAIREKREDKRSHGKEDTSEEGRGHDAFPSHEGGNPQRGRIGGDRKEGKLM